MENLSLPPSRGASSSNIQSKDQILLQFKNSVKSFIKNNGAFLYMYTQTNLLPLNQKLNALQQSDKPLNLSDFNKELAFVSDEIMSMRHCQQMVFEGLKSEQFFKTATILQSYE